MVALGLVARAMLGGVFVVLFALIAEAVSPKRFAGLFAGAPSVALGSLLIGLTVSRPQVLATETLAMIAGAAGFVAFTVVTHAALPRMRAVAAAGAGFLTWCAVCGALYAGLFR